MLPWDSPVDWAQVFSARGEAWNARQPRPRIRPRPHQWKRHTLTPHRPRCRHWTMVIPRHRRLLLRDANPTRLVLVSASPTTIYYPAMMAKILTIIMLSPFLLPPAVVETRRGSGPWKTTRIVLPTAWGRLQSKTPMSLIPFPRAF